MDPAFGGMANTNVDRHEQQRIEQGPEDPERGPAITQAEVAQHEFHHEPTVAVQLPDGIRDQRASFFSPSFCKRDVRRGRIAWGVNAATAATPPVESFCQSSCSR